MFAKNRCAQVLTCIAALGMAVSPVLGATPNITQTQAQTTASVFDVKTSQGHLFGQVVNPTGKAEVGVDVSLTSQNKVVGKTKTDQFGRFAVPLNTTGVYRVAIGQRAFDIRAWQPEVAPPTAKTGLMCVTQDVVRAQYGDCGPCNSAIAAPAPAYEPMAAAPCPAPCGPTGCGPCGGGMLGGGGGMLGGGMGGGLGGILRNPLVVGLGVAAAIAIPIALDDDDDESTSGNGGAGGSGEPAS